MSSNQGSKRINTPAEAGAADRLIEAASEYIVVEQKTSDENDGVSIQVTIDEKPTTGRFARIKNTFTNKKVLAGIGVGFAVVVSVALVVAKNMGPSEELSNDEAVQDEPTDN